MARFPAQGRIDDDSSKAPINNPVFTGTVGIPNYANVETTLDGIATNVTAIALRAPIASPTFTGTIAIPNYANLETTLDTIEINRAPLASPTFTGTVVLPATSLTGDMTISDATDIILNTTTGTKIGTATGQKIGFWNATPVVQQAHIADPSNNVDSLKTAVDSILAQLATLGIQASS